MKNQANERIIRENELRRNQAKREKGMSKYRMVQNDVNQKQRIVNNQMDRFQREMEQLYWGE